MSAKGQELLDRILIERRERWEADFLQTMEVKGKPAPKNDKWKAKYKEPVAPDITNLPSHPGGWVWASLDQIGFIVTGKTPPTQDKSNYGGDVPFYKPSDLDAGFGLRRSEDTITNKGASLVPSVPAGSTLVTCIGATIGKTGFAHVRGATNQQINSVTPISETIVPEWVYYWAITPFFQNLIITTASATTLPILNKGKFSELPIPVAPTTVQRETIQHIESALSRLDKAVADLRSAEVKLKRHRSATLAGATSGRLVPTEAELARRDGRSFEPASDLLQRILAERRARWEADYRKTLEAKGKPAPNNDKWKAKYKEPVAPDTSNLPDLPEGWVWASLGQLLGEPLINGRSVKDADDGFPVLRLTAIRTGVILRDQHKIGAWTAAQAKPFLINEGDFLIARGNGSIKLVGRGGLVVDEGLSVAFPDTMIRARPNAAVILPCYLAHVWDSVHVRTYIESTARTTAGIYKVNQGILELTPVPVPSLCEQQRIVDLIDGTAPGVEAMGKSQGKALARSNSLRSAILQQAFQPERLTEGADHGDR